MRFIKGYFTGRSEKEEKGEEDLEKLKYFIQMKDMECETFIEVKEFAWDIHSRVEPGSRLKSV